jgi:hypothetical protein
MYNSLGVMGQVELRDAQRLAQIREIMGEKIFSDKSKLYEIKLILNKSILDFIESRRQIDPNFLTELPIQKFLLEEAF